MQWSLAQICVHVSEGELLTHSLVISASLALSLEISDFAHRHQDTLYKNHTKSPAGCWLAYSLMRWCKNINGKLMRFIQHHKLQSKTQKGFWMRQTSQTCAGPYCYVQDFK
jgi:hypothetical protein